MEEPSAHGELVTANPRAMAHDPISFKPNACALAVAGSATSPSASMADIAIGNLTVTDERQKLVDFVALDEGRRTISEVVVTGPKSPEIPTLDDLAGKTVQVRKSSSYYESLEALDSRFKKEGKPAVTFVFVPESLEDEDMAQTSIARPARLRPRRIWAIHW